MRTRIFLRYILSIIIMTIIWFLLLTTIFDVVDLWFIHDYINSIYSEDAVYTMEYHLRTYIIPFALYCFMLFILTLAFFIRSASMPDKIYDSFSEIMDENFRIPTMPSVIKPKHTRIVNNIKTDIERKEYIAKEAETRKNDLVVYLAHDLKTPLTSIIGYLTLLEESPELPAAYRAKYTGITLDKAYRLESLINEFFDITRFNMQSMVMEKNRIDLSIMLRQLAEEFYPVLANKNLSVSFTIPEHIRIIGDRDKLARVFDNLLRNASSYSYENTQIGVSAFVENGKAVIMFSNTGDEIPPEKLNMLFEKFFRLDSARSTSSGGAGLGLAIAKEIVEMHGGSISAGSDRNRTVFTVTLPNVIKS